MPKISVIIPIFNGDQYLAESMSSILEQSFEDFEVIIVGMHLRPWGILWRKRK